MAALHGTGVLVTRPPAQAEALCTLLEREGARTWRLPVIEIRARPVDPLDGPFDVILFSSANAVLFGARLLGGQAAAALGAIGPATARALQHAGHSALLQPATHFDSESLLAHPRLHDLQGQRVLLIKGRGGRTLLESGLRARGAQVSSREVYERVPVQPEAAALDALERHASAGELQVVTATSVEIGTRLLAVLTPGLRHALDAALWIVPTARVGAALEALGLRAPLHVARSAEDQDLLAAVLEGRGASSA